MNMIMNININNIVQDNGIIYFTKPKNNIKYENGLLTNSIIYELTGCTYNGIYIFVENYQNNDLLLKDFNELHYIAENDTDINEMNAAIEKDIENRIKLEIEFDTEKILNKNKKIDEIDEIQKNDEEA